MCFLNGIFPSLWVNFLFCCNTYLNKKSAELPLACLFEVSTELWLFTPTFYIKGYDYVKRFVRVLALLVINTGCLKNLLKHGEHSLLISSSNYAKTPYKCVLRRRFVFPVFSNFSETPCMKVGFDVTISSSDE